MQIGLVPELPQSGGYENIFTAKTFTANWHARKNARVTLKGTENRNRCTKNNVTQVCEKGSAELHLILSYEHWM